jgi:4-hydroxy-4-methyl-2-oxoglutarate aldolase
VPSTARSRVMEVACGEPVVIGGVRVRQGDLVLADGTGIVFIPAARAEEVIVLAAQLAAREQAMMVRIRSGEAVSAVMNHQYEAMLQG